MMALPGRSRLDGLDHNCMIYLPCQCNANLRTIKIKLHPSSELQSKVHIYMEMSKSEGVKYAC